MTRTRSKHNDPQLAPPPTRSIKTRSMSSNTIAALASQPTKKPLIQPKKKDITNTNTTTRKTTSTSKLTNTQQTQRQRKTQSKSNSPIQSTSDQTPVSIPTVPTPRVIIPTQKTIDTLQPPVPPNCALQDPSSSSKSILPSVGSSSHNPSSNLSRSHPKLKKEPPRKRLFEDVDTSSQDIFSFLDRKPQNSKLAKPTRRTVFKSSQPSSFLKSNNRAAPETDVTKNKHRSLASTKLLAGSQPQAKRLKKTLPQPTSTSTVQHAPPIPQEPPQITPTPVQQLGIQAPSPTHIEPHVTCNPPPPLPSNSNEENLLLTQTNDPPSESTPSQPPPTLLLNAQLPISQDTSSLTPSNQPSEASLSVPTDGVTSAKQVFEPKPISPLVLSMTRCPSADSISCVDQPVDQSAESSLDAIDFLSPRKNFDKIKKIVHEPSHPQSSISPQVQIEMHSSDQAVPPDGDLSTEPKQPATNPSLEMTTTEVLKPISTNPSLEMTTTEVLKPIGDVHNPERDTELDPSHQSSIPDTVPSLNSQPACDDPTHSNQALDDQASSSQSPSSLADAQLAPPLEDNEASNEQPPPPISPSGLNSVTPDESSLREDPPVSPIRPEPSDSKAERISTPPTSFPRLIPKRTSPIKHPTLPTSIPIMKPLPPLAPQQVPPAAPPGNNPSPGLGLSSHLVSSRPSMLPRRALKPAMGTSQPLTFNTVPSLDAIIETSPEKKPVRDALSAASLNRSRGFGLPPRMMFTGGIKSKAEAIFSRPMAGSSNPLFSHGSIGGGTKVDQESLKTQEQTHQTDNTTSQQEQNPIKHNLQAKEGVAAEEEEEENISIDSSLTSISTEHSTVTTSSNLSTCTNKQNENHQQQFSGNISIDTQDRLTKLQKMLTRMGRSESNDTSNSHSFQNSNPNFRQQQYKEYEVDIKNDDDDSHQREGRTNETGYGTRSCRRRSSSVPLNYSENTTLSRSSSRSQSVAANPLITTSTSRGQSKGVPAARRRVSNILPSARVDNLPGSSTTNQQDPTSSNASSTANNTSSIVGSASTGGSHNTASNIRNRRSSVHHPNTAPTPLRNVVAFVDVRTAEGDDAGKVFVEMLKGLGAKVVGRPVFPLTHIIFKAGRQSTIERYMIHPRPKPQLVGIGWIVRCREILSKAEEGPYKIDINSSQVPFNFEPPRTALTTNVKDVNVASHLSGTSTAHNRRKSMEPKALSLLNSAIQLNLSSANNQSSSSGLILDSSLVHPLSQSCTTKPATNEPTNQNDPSSAAPAVVVVGSSTSKTNEQTMGVVNNNYQQDAILAQKIDKARRKSLQFLPKVGSPLASKVYTIT